MRILIGSFLFIIVSFCHANENKVFHGIQIGATVESIENFKIIKTRAGRTLESPTNIVDGEILNKKKRFFLVVIDGYIEGIESVQYVNEHINIDTKLAEIEQNWGQRIKERDLIVEDIFYTYEFPDIYGGKYIFNIYYIDYDLVMTETYISSKAIPLYEDIRDDIISWDETDITAMRMDAETRRKADAGDAQAQINIGKMYVNKYYLDDEVFSDDMRKAHDWIEKAADQGSSEAQMYLGIIYFKGYGVYQDYEKAFKLFRKSASQGEIRAKDILEYQCTQGHSLACDQ